jgi:hypothetical protein
MVDFGRVAMARRGAKKPIADLSWYPALTINPYEYWTSRIFLADWKSLRTAGVVLLSTQSTESTEKPLHL